MSVLRTAVVASAVCFWLLAPLAIAGAVTFFAVHTGDTPATARVT